MRNKNISGSDIIRDLNGRGTKRERGHVVEREREQICSGKLVSPFSCMIQFTPVGLVDVER